MRSRASNLLDTYVALARGALLGAVLVPVSATICSRLGDHAALRPGFALKVALAIGGAVGIHRFLRAGERRFTATLAEMSSRQAAFLAEVPVRWLWPAIFTGAGLGIFLELATIRWQASVFELFAFYKNLGLLACFVGLGLGYALSGRAQIPLSFAPLMFAAEIATLTFTRHGIGARRARSVAVTPIHEQLSMGFLEADSLWQHAAIYFLLLIAFLLTALAFLPIGQLTGALMEREEKLRAYGANLLGSLAGVVLMLGLSSVWTPPTVWFAFALAVVLVFQIFDLRSLLAASLAALGAVVALSWPVGFGWERIYSPYQLIERGPSSSGFMELRAAGTYHQRVLDLSTGSQQARPSLKRIARYYELPYRMHGSPERVAVVGAGTGNDVAAALRSGAIRVDAVEIDPAILRLGESYHPEKPYSDSRVTAVVDDARSFLRNTASSYDVISYGLLDSHTLLSHASNVRLDSFVYTVEALREARARLDEGGILSISFAILSKDIGRKIFLMLQEAFDGRPPLAIEATYDMAVVFLQGRDRPLALPAALLDQDGLRDATATYADATLRADPSTDDWPFLYMPRRVYPLSYFAVVVLMLGASVSLARALLRDSHGPGGVGFFFLGAGFMLIETKGITELGLVFGNTWQVVAVVLSGILAMAYLANLAVRLVEFERPQVPFLLLATSLAVGALISSRGGFPSTTAGRFAAAVILTLPLFFSGIAFSTMLRRSGSVSGAMALNLMGAVCGGLLEYNSMYFGFRFLTWLAMGLYAAAFLAARSTAEAPVGAPLLAGPGEPPD